jgi:mannose-6-phosphate isomerase-like protein (cupin superfamily)
MKGYFGHLEEDVKKNSNFRKVLYTGHHSQLVFMSLLPGEEIGMEVHSDNDQFFRFDQGEGKVIVDDNEYEVKDGDAVLVPAGAAHNVINTGSESLRFYTIYSPPHHKDGIVRKTKKEAEEQMAEFDGETTE